MFNTPVSVAQAEAKPWWSVDLGSVQGVWGVRAWVAASDGKRAPSQHGANLTLLLSNKSGTPSATSIQCYTYYANDAAGPRVSAAPLYPGSSPLLRCAGAPAARYVTLVGKPTAGSGASATSLSLCEVEVYSPTEKACPASCLRNRQPRAPVAALHDFAVLAAAAANASSPACNDTNASLVGGCDGRPEQVLSELPGAPPRDVRLGAFRYHGFFVAPVTAEYTFRARFDEVGELWLSPDANPRHAELLLSAPAKLPVASGAGGPWKGWFGPSWTPWQAHVVIELTSGTSAPLAIQLLGTRGRTDEVLLARGITTSGVHTFVKDISPYDVDGASVQLGVLRAVKLRLLGDTVSQQFCVGAVRVTVRGVQSTFGPRKSSTGSVGAGCFSDAMELDVRSVRHVAHLTHNSSVAEPAVLNGYTVAPLSSGPIPMAEARRSPLRSPDSSQFPSTCPSSPLAFGCSNVAC